MCSVNFQKHYKSLTLFRLTLEKPWNLECLPSWSAVLVSCCIIVFMVLQRNLHQNSILLCFHLVPRHLASLISALSIIQCWQSKTLHNADEIRFLEILCSLFQGQSMVVSLRFFDLADHLISKDLVRSTSLFILNIRSASFELMIPLVHISTIHDTIPLNCFDFTKSLVSHWEKKTYFASYLIQHIPLPLLHSHIKI